MKEINLVDENAGAAEEQICRTCAHSGNRLYKIGSPMKVAKLIRDGVDVSDMRCNPRNDDDFTRVVHVIPRKQPNQFRAARDFVVNVPSSQSDSFRSDGTATRRTLALVASCGQEIAPGCKTCARFVPVTTPVPWTANGAKTRYRDQLIGGHCSIPVEGIWDEVQNKTVFCQHIPKTSEIEPSCLNCQFLTTPTIVNDFTRDVGRVDLTPSEMFHARRVAMGSDMPGAVINNIKHELLSHPNGVMLPFTATILEVKPNGYLIQFQGSGYTADIAHDDDFVRVYPLSFGDRALVHIQAPHHEKFGLSVQTLSRRRRIPLQNIPPATIRVPNPNIKDLASRVNAKCVESDQFGTCEPGLPCAHHVKLPEVDFDSGELVYTDPTATTYINEPTPEWDIHLIDGSLVDGNGNPANIAVLHATWRKHEGDRDWIRAYIKEWVKYPTRIVSREVGWPYIDTSGEIFKRECGLHSSVINGAATVIRKKTEDSDNQAPIQVPGAFGTTHGLNFRELFGDAFGQPREENDYSWAFRMETEALQRAGITPRTPNEREFSTHKLHEEILLNEAAYSHRIVPFAGFESDPKITVFNFLNQPITDYQMTITLGPWTQITTTNRDEFYGMDRVLKAMWLDQQSYQDLTVEYEDLVDGRKIRVKTTSRVHWSNRFIEHGYDLMRYARKGKGTAKTDAPMSPDDVMRMRLSHEAPVAERSSAWFCITCNASYPSTDVDMERLCPECDSTLVFRDLDASFGYIPRPQKTTDGMSTVIWRDYPWHLEQTRLLAMCCDSWVRRNSSPANPITLTTLNNRTRAVSKDRDKFVGIEFHKATPRR